MGRVSVRIKKVDAFTETPLTGNPAGVVEDAAGLSEERMQLIAREMAAPETAFILPAERPGADLRIRWFTPTVEVPLCGHATIAAFHALAEDGMYGMLEPNTYHFTVETRSGNLPVTVEKGPGGVNISFGLHVPDFVRAGQYKLDVMRVLNISLDEFENRMPIVRTDYLYVPVRRLHTMFAMKPNFFALSQFLRNRNLLGLCAFTTETVERTSAVHSRFFAPPVGIEEDPVTGSANGPLGAYLFRFGKLEAPGGSLTLVGEQGDVMGRKGRVLIHLSVEKGEIGSLRIGGRAVTILSGQMLLASGA